ncbi:MAG TPA: hypothetical protein VNG33_01325 [Polyangiaceae bacterium]|nr:hypothetical protein [Polyangiaceae bacterium]
MRLVPLFGALLAVSACAGARGHAGGGGGAGGGDGVAGAAGQSDVAGASPVATSAELGVPGGPDGLDFMPLADGSVLKLQTFGQGGTHVIVGVRCTGFGSRAFVSATLHNEVTGVEVAEPPPARPQLLYCDDQGVCDLVPYLVHASGIAATDAEKDGLHVLLSAKVKSESGLEAEASREVVLSTADL